MTTQFRRVSMTTVALVSVVALGATGCGKYSPGSLMATKAFKDANAKYAAQDWKEAVAKYEEALKSDPNYDAAHFYLANSYDNMYKPARKGEAANDAYMQKAIDHYKIAAEKDPVPATRKLALQYLVAAYGPEKLSDPSQAEPIVKRMVELEPNEPTNYFGLSKLYEDAGRYDEAEQALMKARDIKPNDPIVFTTLSGYYNRQGDFQKTIENLEKAAELDPKNPQGFHLIATFFEEKVRKDFRLTPAEKMQYSLKGIEAEDKALALNPSYVDAMIVKNILLRHEANAEKDPAKQKELIKQADEIRTNAIAIQKGAKAAADAAGPAKKK
jgi:tetratricopeptide (TPR) repeat protein